MSANNNFNDKKTASVVTDIPSSEAEYDMLRAEILQYMEEYQNLRNMMYIGTATLLGLNSAVWENLYVFLLPLIIILPSYILFVDYWKSVEVASIYIQIFLEKDVNGKLIGNRRWESMHHTFAVELLRNNDGSVCWKRRLAPMWSGMPCHKIPYVVCTSLCLTIYGYFVVVGKYGEDDIQMGIAIIIGLIALVACLAVFIFYRSPDTETIREVWERIRNNGNEAKINTESLTEEK